MLPYGYKGYLSDVNYAKSATIFLHMILIMQNSDLEKGLSDIMQNQDPHRPTSETWGYVVPGTPSVSRASIVF